MVTKFLWKHDLIAEESFNKAHLGYYDGIRGLDSKAPEEPTLTELNTEKWHYYKLFYTLGVIKYYIRQILSEIYLKVKT